MDKAMIKHWTSRSVADFVYRVASDFIIQLEKRLEVKDISKAEMADRAGVSEGRLSQIFNNPGNLTLKSVVQYARALGLKVALVAYDDRDPENENGPINSEIFEACWQTAGRPHDFFELVGVYGDVYQNEEPVGNLAYRNFPIYPSHSASTQNWRVI
jgi:transcriptional regulator with XRE-family HTH domain